LVLVCVKSTAQTHDHLYRPQHIGINFLAHDQIDIASVFAHSGGDKFARLAWHPGASGAPVLDQVSAHFEIAVEQRLPAGTHTIFIGRVIEAEATGRPPLAYFDGAFFDGDRLAPVSG
jgi:flavin reductase (DIM6/NTAB) family NADH-FMN oxidoreductase RutF